MRRSRKNEKSPPMTPEEKSRAAEQLIEAEKRIAQIDFNCCDYLTWFLGFEDRVGHKAMQAAIIRVLKKRFNSPSTLRNISADFIMRNWWYYYAENHNGRNPFEIAVLQGRESIIEELIDALYEEIHRHAEPQYEYVGDLPIIQLFSYQLLIPTLKKVDTRFLRILKIRGLTRRKVHQWRKLFTREATSRCPNVTSAHLYLHSSNANEMIPRFASWPQLTVLTLRDFPLDEECLRLLLEHCPQLVQLACCMGPNDPSERGVRLFENFAKMTDLEITPYGDLLDPYHVALIAAIMPALLQFSYYVKAENFLPVFHFFDEMKTYKPLTVPRLKILSVDHDLPDGWPPEFYVNSLHLVVSVATEDWRNRFNEFPGCPTLILETFMESSREDTCELLRTLCYMTETLEVLTPINCTLQDILRACPHLRSLDLRYAVPSGNLNPLLFRNITKVQRVPCMNQDDVTFLKNFVEGSQCIEDLDIGYVPAFDYLIDELKRDRMLLSGLKSLRLCGDSERPHPLYNDRVKSAEKTLNVAFLLMFRSNLKLVQIYNDKHSFPSILDYVPKVLKEGGVDMRWF